MIDLQPVGHGHVAVQHVLGQHAGKVDGVFRRAELRGIAQLGVGLLLPCNVCVWEEENGSVVSIARPQAMFDLVRNDALQPVVDDADQRLRRALEAAQTKSI